MCQGGQEGVLRSTMMLVRSVPSRSFRGEGGHRRELPSQLGRLYSDTAGCVVVFAPYQFAVCRTGAILCFMRSAAIASRRRGQALGGPRRTGASCFYVCWYTVRVCLIDASLESDQLLVMSVQSWLKARRFAHGIQADRLRYPHHAPHVTLCMQSASSYLLKSLSLCPSAKTDRDGGVVSPK